MRKLYPVFIRRAVIAVKASSKNTLPALLILLLFTGCAMNWRQAALQFDKHIQRGDYSSFIGRAANSPWYSGPKNEFLYNLDTGTASVFQGDYLEGAQRLMRAGYINEDSYTTSVSSQLVSVLVNDTTLPYSGEDYEVSFAANLAALSFAAAGDWEAALVEVRKAGHRLQVMSDAYDGKEKYSDDAFSHYLAAMLYESAGYTGEAVVSYRLARRAYNTPFFPHSPPKLDRELLSTAMAAGVNPGFDFADRISPADTGESSVILCVFTGRGPYKEETVIEAPFISNGILHTIKVSVPTMMPRQSSINGLNLSVNDVNHPIGIAADYNHIGTKAFELRQGAIIVKTVARISTRYIALNSVRKKAVENLREEYDKARDEHGEFSIQARNAYFRYRTSVVAFNRLAGEILERADTRCSMIIPGRVWLSKIPLDAGEHVIKLEYLSSSGTVLRSEERKLQVEKGETQVIISSALF